MTDHGGTAVRWRPILATGLVLGAAGSAAVMWGGRWVMRGIEEGFSAAFLDDDDGIWHIGDDYDDGDPNYDGSLVAAYDDEFVAVFRDDRE